MNLVTEEVRVALETERKFEFYVIAAVFTILGLAVHTATAYEQPIRNYLEIGAFVMLFISFLCAIFAVSRLMHRHWVIADMQGWAAGLQVLRSAQAQGLKQVTVAGHVQPQPIEDQIDRFESNRAQEEVKSIKSRWWIDLFRITRMWTFFLGLMLLLLTKLWPIFLHPVS